MHSNLERIFETGTFTTSKGEVVKVNSETSKGQCEFIQKILLENNFKNSLEIGFAFGVSTLSILEVIAKRGGKHYVIDKFQNLEWGGYGIDLINQSGFSNDLRFFEEFSYRVLPDLIKEGKKFDFAYVDSTKVFDWLVVDFFLIDKLLSVGGVIVFDDTGYYSVRKLSRFISCLPHYALEAPYPENVDPGLFQKVAGKLVGNLSKTYTDYKKGINSACTAFRKLGEDERHWKWHKEF